MFLLHPIKIRKIFVKSILKILKLDIFKMSIFQKGRGTFVFHFLKNGP